MSNQYQGGIITKSPATPTGPYESGAAPGIWTLIQQAAYKQQGVWPTAGLSPNYIEDVFSTWLYTGIATNTTITNSIDLSGKGGMVWIKQRNTTRNHLLFDTVRGATKRIFSDLTNAESVATNQLTAFNSNGFSLGNDTGCNQLNGTYASWTFREQSKFFDVVTYTGNGTQGRSVSHNLGSAPGFMIVKRLDAVDNWRIYHRSLGGTKFMSLDTTAAASTANTLWNDADPTSTVFYLGNDASVNASGGTYVAYLFAHDAGGFGLTGTDNVISCGSYTGIAYPTSLEVTLGFEPQFVIIKNATTTSGWAMWDVMRGMSVVPAVNTAQALLLEPNTSAADSNQPGIFPTATGFVVKNGLTSISGSGDTMVYIAVRRGPMKTPTTGTSVYQADYRNATAPGYTSGFPVDLVIDTAKSGDNRRTSSRLQGAVLMQANSTIAETSDSTRKYDYMDGWSTDTGASTDYLSWMFKRAPSFMDVVCYTGTGSALSVSHNLQAVPELMIVKRRNSATYGDWYVYTAFSGNAKYQALNSTIAATSAGIDVWSLTNPTSTIMSVGSDLSFSASTYVAYLFATCAGVSKVGSYTGNGSTQTINCGFGAGGARFVLIKRTDATGDWYVYDTARGMTVLTDPYLLLNTTAAEVATLGSVTTVSTGFALNSAILAAINVNAGTYIFLAIA
jgi:hypothetical protein